MLSDTFPAVATIGKVTPDVLRRFFALHDCDYVLPLEMMMKALLAMFSGILVLIGCGTNDAMEKSSLNPISDKNLIDSTEKGIRLMHDTDCD